MNEIDKVVADHGFANQREFFTLVALADISTPEKQDAFKKWQEEDGTKEGLLKLSGKWPIKLEDVIKGEEDHAQ